MIGLNDIPTKMKALVIEGNRELVFKDIPVPELKPDEVLIRVRACGICGSDIPRVLHNGVHFYPITVGHEFSGEIAKVGDEVKGVEVGDNVTFEQGACIEPTTVAIHGVERAGSIDSDKSAIVFGCGTIGMLTLEVLKAKGLERVYAIDIDDNKLEMAKTLGACDAINSTRVEVVKYFNEHGLVDYAFETAGVPFLQAQILEMVKKKGTVVYVGTAHNEVKIPAKEKILRGKLNVTGSWQRKNRRGSAIRRLHQ